MLLLVSTDEKSSVRIPASSVSAVGVEVAKPVDCAGVPDAVHLHMGPRSVLEAVTLVWDSAVTYNTIEEDEENVKVGKTNRFQFTSQIVQRGLF